MNKRKYLINKGKDDWNNEWCYSVAHIWQGDDTACTMWSTGGLKTAKYRVYDELPEDCQVCQTCEKALAHPGSSHPHTQAISSKRLMLKALGTIICMMCESKYGWPEGENTEYERKKLVRILREEAWIPKMDKPVMPERGVDHELAR